MDPSDFLTDGKSPRRELQGPRPAPLKVRKDSYKIKKPPVAPPPQQSQQKPQYRPPVIIYTVSPKVIHTDPSEFMKLVQRLTGSTSSSSSSSSSYSSSSSSSAPPRPPSSSYNYHPFSDNNIGAISPAARYASIEKTKSPEGKKKTQTIINGGDDGGGFFEGVEMGDGVERTCLFPGILSPGPTSLPPIPPNFFSPPSDSFFHDLSPVVHGNKTYIEGSFMPSPVVHSNNKGFLESSFIMPSPSNFLSPHIPPSPYLDIFNNFLDF